MADQSQVEDALVHAASSAMYPNGTDQPSALGPDCRIYRGWPIAAALDADLTSGNVNITISPAGTPGEVTTRYADEWAGEPAVASLMATVAGNSVIIEGRAGERQVAGLLADGRSYAYRVQRGDTAELVAANLAALARNDWIVSLEHSRITVEGAHHVAARVVADTPVVREVRRQRQAFRIVCWCATPELRDRAATVIDAALAGSAFLSLSDGTQGRITYDDTSVYDQSQNALLYRRDLLFTVEYPTIVTALQPTMLFGGLSVNAANITA